MSNRTYLYCSCNRTTPCGTLWGMKVEVPFAVGARVKVSRKGFTNLGRKGKVVGFRWVWGVLDRNTCRVIVNFKGDFDSENYRIEHSPWELELNTEPEPIPY